MKLKLTVFTLILCLLPLSLDAKTPRKRTAARRTTTAQAAPAISGWAAKWKEKAEAGDPEAQYELAFCYFWTIGVKKDYAKAMEWAKKSSEQGFPEATELVGRMYYFGNGVTEDKSEADRWFKLALQQATPLAEAGDPHAQYALSVLYNKGRGVDKDLQQALKWLRLSAEKGYHWAQNSLGYDYENGDDGVTKDYSEAVKWYRLAAEQGNPWAQDRLGDCYYFGNGVSENYSEAVKWFQKAANQGFPRGQYNLGYCYTYGKGVAKNASLGRQWLKKAADNGNKSAKNELNKQAAQPFIGEWCHYLYSGRGTGMVVTIEIWWDDDDGVVRASYYPSYEEYKLSGNVTNGVLKFDNGISCRRVGKKMTLNDGYDTTTFSRQ